MSVFYVLSPRNCYRDDDAVRFNANGTMTIAIYLPDSKEINLEQYRKVQFNHCVFGPSETPCRFGQGCRRRDICTFAHPDGRNCPIVHVKHPYPLNKDQRAGFTSTDGRKSAVMITVSFIGGEITMTDVSYGLIATKHVYHDEQLPSDLEIGIDLFIENYSQIIPYIEGETIEPCTFDKDGKIVQNKRPYDKRRYFVESCMDIFNYLAQRTVERVNKNAQLMGIEYENSLFGRYARRSEVQLYHPVLFAPSQGCMATFTHPLRDIECLYNLHVLANVKKFSNVTIPPPTEQELAWRRMIIDYLNKIRTANPTA